MGWSSGWSSKKELVACRLRDYQAGGRNIIVAYKSTASGLWIVVEDDSGERSIGFDLMEKRAGTWGYKDMCEAMGPYTYDCPIAFLDLAPVKSQDWRDRVRHFHDRKDALRQFRASLRCGMTLLLKGCGIPEITISVIEGRNIYGRYQDAGPLYRIKPSILANATIKEP